MLCCVVCFWVVCCCDVMWCGVVCVVCVVCCSLVWFGERSVRVAFESFRTLLFPFLFFKWRYSTTSLFNLYLFFSINVSVILYAHLSFWFRSVCLCVCAFVSVFLYVRLSGCQAVCLSVRMCVCLPVCVSIYPCSYILLSSWLSFFFLLFYFLSLSLQVFDALERVHQCATVQVTNQIKQK